MDGKDAQDEEYKRISRRGAVTAVNSKFMYIPNLRNLCKSAVRSGKMNPVQVT